jgi:hypothetical protein
MLNLLEVESAGERSDTGGLKWSHSVGVTEFLTRASVRFLFPEYVVFLSLRHISGGSSNAGPLPVCVYTRDGYLVGGMISLALLFCTFSSQRLTSRSFTRPSSLALFCFSSILSRQGLLVQQARIHMGRRNWGGGLCSIWDSCTLGDRTAVTLGYVRLDIMPLMVFKL